MDIISTDRGSSVAAAGTLLARIKGQRQLMINPSILKMSRPCGETLLIKLQN